MTGPELDQTDGIQENGTSRVVVGFIGFGEAARSFADVFAARPEVEVLVFCNGTTNLPPYTPAFIRQVEGLSGSALMSLEDLARRADAVISAVVPESAEDVGMEFVRYARPGQLLVDITASSPTTKRRLGEAVARAGALYVDANLMGAVSIYGGSVQLYCSGDGAQSFAVGFQRLGLNIEVCGPAAGDAATVKMLRSIVTKGMEALLVEALLGAHRAGILEETFAKICEPMDRISFTAFAEMCVNTDVLHSRRRAFEMTGAAEFLLSLGLEPTMTKAVAERLLMTTALALRDAFVERTSYSYADVIEAYGSEMERREREVG